MQNNQFYGWFDDAGQGQPSRDPPHDGPCLFCGYRLHPADVLTISLMFAGPIYAKRSYFYRVHRSCSENESQTPMDSFVFAMIERNGD